MVGGFSRTIVVHSAPIPVLAVAVLPRQLPRAVPYADLGGFEGCGVAPKLGPSHTVYE